MEKISLREFIRILKENNELALWKALVSIKYEISKILKEHDDGVAILFPQVKDYDIGVVGNVVSKVTIVVSL